LIFGQPYSGHGNGCENPGHAPGPLTWSTALGMSDRLGPMVLRIGEEHVFLGKEIQELADFLARARLFRLSIKKYKTS